MAEEAKSLYSGPGNRGYATILGTQAPSLFDVMDSLKADREADEALKREQEKAKADELSELLKYNPDKIWEPYNEAQQQLYNDYMDEAVKVYGEEGIVSASSKGKLYKMQNDIKTLTNKTNSFNTAREKAFKEIIDDPKSNVDKEKYARHLGRIQLDIENKLIAPMELGSELIMGPLNDYNFYDQRKVVDSILGGIEENVEMEINDQPFGYRIEETRSWKEGFRYEMIDDGEGGKVPKRDDDGQYIFEVTDALVKRFSSDSEGAMMIQKIKDQHEALGETVTTREAVKELVSPNAYFKEKKQAENDALELQYNREKSKGNTDKDEANIWFQNLDTLLVSPQEDETKSLEYYVDEDGNINKGGRGNVLKPVSSQLNGVVVGKSTERGKTTNVTITDTLHDFNTGTTYYKTSDSDDLKILNRENSPDLLQQIVNHNPRYKGYIGFGRQLGYLGQTTEGKSYYNRKIKDSDAIKNNKESQKQQSEKIKIGIQKFKDAVNTAMEARKGAGRSFFFGMKQDAVNQLNNTLSSIPQGVEIALGGNTYTNPDIEIKGSFLESSYTFWINGENTQVEASEENFNLLMEGMKPTRALAVKQDGIGSPQTSGQVTNEDPLGLGI